MGSRAKKRARLSTIYEKQKELAMISVNLEKIYVVGIKIVSTS
jgi:hypothetical protein